MKDFVRHYKQLSIVRKRNPISKDAFTLYHLLLEYDNELGWMDNFTAPNGMLTGSLRGFSQDSLERARNELISKGYIRYSRGSGNQAGRYLIVDFAEQNLVQTAEQIAAQPAEQTQAQPRNKSRTLTKPNENQTKGTTPLPPDGFCKAFDAFVAMRVKIKKPMTDHAKDLILEKLETLAPGDRATQAKILDQSTVNCWQGVFQLKAEEGRQPNEQRTANPGDISGFVSAEAGWGDI